MAAALEGTGETYQEGKISRKVAEYDKDFRNTYGNVASHILAQHAQDTAVLIFLWHRFPSLGMRLPTVMVPW